MLAITSIITYPRKIEIKSHKINVILTHLWPHSYLHPLCSMNGLYHPHSDLKVEKTMLSQQETTVWLLNFSNPPISISESFLSAEVGRKLRRFLMATLHFLTEACYIAWSIASIIPVATPTIILWGRFSRDNSTFKLGLSSWALLILVA